LFKSLENLLEESTFTNGQTIKVCCLWIQLYYPSLLILCLKYKSVRY
jgi:hypothetical protein